MEHLKHPSSEQWEERRKWFENMMNKYESEGSYLVSEQACALIAEVQSCFCAGAWISVIILAFTVIDAQLRETELPDHKGDTKKLLNILGFDQKFQKLRDKRNKIIHLDTNNPAITVDEQWANRNQLEKEATEAVKLMAEAFYSNPGV